MESPSRGTIHLCVMVAQEMENALKNVESPLRSVKISVLYMKGFYLTMFRMYSGALFVTKLNYNLQDSRRYKQPRLLSTRRKQKFRKKERKGFVLFIGLNIMLQDST